MKGKIKIILKGHLDQKWTDWFEGMDITYIGNNTSISGDVKDEAFMFGILNRIRDLNLTLISINPSEGNDKNLL